jgi:hypothetical protein
MIMSYADLLKGLFIGIIIGAVGLFILGKTGVLPFVC